MQPWLFDGQTRLVLGLATPQDLTRQNVRQTVLAILGASTMVLLLSLCVGQWWVRRYTSPIVQLTASVKAVSSGEALPGCGAGNAPSLPRTLSPADLAAPDEIGELQRSFDTLEQQVQKRTAELRQQARYLRTLIDMLPMQAWFKNASSRYLVVNEALARDRGRTVPDMTGKFDAELFAAAQAEQQRAADADVMTARAGRSIEQRVPEGGAETWREIYLAPVVDEDGSVLGTVGVARDISDRKAVEAARESALAEARHLAMQRSDFLAHMSHELRTPLNGILDLARIDAGRLDLHPEDFDLHALLQAVCDMVRLKAEEKRLHFVFAAAADLPALVRLDKKRLRQVLLNLLSNAIKFTDAGEVSLRVQRVPLTAKTGARVAALVRFEVQDAGIGLTPPEVERLFPPFEQFGDRKRREGGSGLGLAISQQLVRLMGGAIQVHSRPGEGSRFAFEIATSVASQPPTAALLPLAVPIGYVGSRKRALVVDDVEQNRAVLLGLLGILGFELAEASNGAEAMEVTARWRPDLVLMDLMMPVMDGFEAIRRLRQAPDTAGLPVIAASARHWA